MSSEFGASPLVVWFLFGLMSGAHCVGMCGGIVGALCAGCAGHGPARRFGLHLGYNAGRLLSYAFQGLLIGWVGGGMLLAGETARAALLAFASLMLIATGLYLMGEQRVLGMFERAGAPVWQRLKGLTARFLPARRLKEALPLGFLWGFLPCGLVYNALASALSSGSPAKGALILLAFGLGTLPNLLLAGFFLSRFRTLWQKRATRLIIGLIIIAYGLVGLWDAWQLRGI